MRMGAGEGERDAAREPRTGRALRASEGAVSQSALSLRRRRSRRRRLDRG